MSSLACGRLWLVEAHPAPTSMSVATRCLYHELEALGQCSGASSLLRVAGPALHSAVPEIVPLADPSPPPTAGEDGVGAKLMMKRIQFRNCHHKKHVSAKECMLSMIGALRRCSRHCMSIRPCPSLGPHTHRASTQARRMSTATSWQRRTQS